MVGTFGITAVNVVLSMFTSVLLARYLGPEGRGTVVALTIWPALLAAIFCLSLNEAVTYHVSLVRSKEKPDETNRVCATALAAQLVTAIGATCCSLLVLPSLVGLDRLGDLWLVMCYAAAFTPLTILDMHYKSVLQGRGEFRSLNVNRVCQPILFALILGVLFALRCIRVETVLIAMIAPLGCSVLLGFILDGARMPIWDGVEMRRLLGTARRFHAMNIVMYSSAEADKVIVVLSMGDTSAGLYASALPIGALGSGLVLQSLLVLLFPEMTAATRKEEQARILCRHTQDASLLLVLINGSMALVCPWVVPFVFGSDFAAAVPVTMILLFMNTLKGVRQVIDRAMRATLSMRFGVVSEAVGLGCFVALGPFASSFGGLAGIAVALVLAQAAALAVMATSAVKCYNLKCSDLWGLRPETGLRLFKMVLHDVQRVKSSLSR
ncbi:MAG: lipopolysaccharide biosynthesis protein [Verrucomicrobiales bacterium]|nr:lipopolysaccharide biosynthesis protein [Verrucomicrobiales bacterium]